jgi:NADPH-dependent curcumin reductase CurA
MPGMTAYMGLLEIGKPAAGETVVVAAASGAVGSVVGQIARIKGARAVGIAGGPDKCRYVIEELGFDGCIDHRAPDLAVRLAATCPKGIDVYFENVGGAVFEAVFPLLNQFARIPVCGLISCYNATTLSPGSILLPHMMRATANGCEAGPCKGAQGRPALAHERPAPGGRRVRAVPEGDHGAPACGSHFAP